MSGQNELRGGEEEAEEVRDEADNGREDERGVLEEENMAWVPLALSSCAICCLSEMLENDLHLTKRSSW